MKLFAFLVLKTTDFIVLRLSAVLNMDATKCYMWRTFTLIVINSPKTFLWNFCSVLAIHCQTFLRLILTFICWENHLDDQLAAVMLPAIGSFDKNLIKQLEVRLSNNSLKNFRSSINCIKTSKISKQLLFDASDLELDFLQRLKLWFRCSTDFKVVFRKNNHSLNRNVI